MAEILGPFRGALRISIGHELRSEFPDPGDHSHSDTKAGRGPSDPRVACQFARPLKHAAAQFGQANFFIHTREKNKGLAERKQAKDDHKNDPEQGSQKDLTRSKQGRHFGQDRREKDQADDRKDAPEEGCGIGEAQRTPGFAPRCHRVAIISGQRVDRSPRRVDQNGRDRTSIH